MLPAHCQLRVPRSHHWAAGLLRFCSGADRRNSHFLLSLQSKDAEDSRDEEQPRQHVRHCGSAPDDWGCAMLFAPGLEFVDVGPVKASFSAEQQAALQPLISFCGSLVLIAAMMFSGIKWNPINGKMGGLGSFFCAVSFVYMGTQVGSGVFFYY